MMLPTREGWARAVGTYYRTRDGRRVLITAYIVRFVQTADEPIWGHVEGCLDAPEGVKSVTPFEITYKTLFWDESGNFKSGQVSPVPLKPVEKGHSMDLIEWEMGKR